MNKGIGAGMLLAVVATLPVAVQSAHAQELNRGTSTQASAAPISATSAKPVPAFNQVYLSTDAAVEKRGSFVPVRAYLGHSDEVLKAVGKGLDRFSFLPQLPYAGFYRVYAWWPIEAMAGTATVTVMDRDGSHRQLIEQRSDGGQWRDLGSYDFAAGPARIEFAESKGLLLVDALRIEYLGNKAPALKLEQNKLPLVETGIAYREKIPVSGGVAPFEFAIVSGRLPAGLVLDARTGEVRGRAQDIGHHDLIVTVKDARGVRGSGHLQLDVIEGDPVLASAARSETQQAGRSLNANPNRSKIEGGDARSYTGDGDLSGLLADLTALPEGEWLHANQNLYSDVWTPAVLRPLNNGGNPDPSKIIGAWSGFAWDSNRGDLLLYGGGHANYSGNDVYRWRGSTRMWERASLPSEVVKDIRGNFVAIDGVSHAPASAHTYDNNIFLPLHDKMLAFGGAAYNNGGMFLSAVDALTSRKTGPYLFDPAKADPNKVGGSNGSHVKRVGPYPDVLGGDMWQNREMFLNLVGNPKLPGSHVEGCTGYAEEDGRDVVYVGARLGGGTATSVFRYVITDLANPALDVWQQVGGYWDGPQGQATCAYDAQQKVFLRTGSATRPFVFWNLNTPGPTNYEKYVSFTDSSGQFLSLLSAGTIKMRDCGLDFDPVARRYALWCGGNQLWLLTPPATFSSSGWQLDKAPAPIGTGPSTVMGTGILGKWKFIPNLNAFMALQDSSQGNIWIYKPIGWQPPLGDDNIRPSVSLDTPYNGQQFAADEPITLTATATDSDGNIARVEFYDGSSLLATDNEAPYQFVWNGAPSGNRNLLARAYDDRNGQGNSAVVSITVQAGQSGTVILQDGVGGYAGTRDNYLSSYSKASNYGSSTLVQEQGGYYTPMLRFAIFQREGGPVPDNSVIQSVRLKIYKYSSYDPRYAMHRLLRDWDEKLSSWNNARSGEAWTVPGAGGAGTDYLAPADAEVTAPWSAGWLDFDVTVGVQAMQNGEPNYGWRLRRVSGDNANLKRFYTRELSTDPGKRPILEVTYAAP
ncbi:DNRLRE domain-containing protein [Permianibacter sp. IMCC34836]|uniref:DNRLRE domain-containing protein n=1 Tax=Permianibacter fluminis TaxID=2738515 RepID=UPI001551D82A|nr:DNRLRE domain-containing protein [Permianibacter fluminis]NQD36694.1 DNRLRE domain-containing protein [Permianibacter fluminis]